MTYPCPRGHQSTDVDYCSECGARINAMSLQFVTPAPTATSAAGAAAAATDRCPDCATLRPAGARYCEVCRYDFQSRSSYTGGPMAVPTAAPAPAPVAAPAPVSPGVVAPPPIPPAASAQPAALAPSTAPAVGLRLQLRIVADPTLDTEPDPDCPCPVGQPDRLFHLDLDENTLGRQFEGKGVHPEIVVNDPGISRRQVKFLRADDGSFSVLELGSANGTELNGKTLEAGVLTPVQPGDTLLMGMWTRVTVEAR